MLLAFTLAPISSISIIIIHKSEMEKPKLSLTLAQQEIEATNKLLDLQRAENLKFVEHVQILHNEIASLNHIVNEKQQEINRLLKVIAAKDTKIVSLNETIDSLKVDNSVIHVFTAQNMEILGKLQSVEAELEEERKQKVAVSDELAQFKQIYDEKVKSMTELELNIRTVEHELLKRLENLNNKVRKLDAENVAYQESNRTIASELKEFQRNTRDTVIKAKQTEYESVFQVDELNIKISKLEDEKEALRGQLEMENFRVRSIEDRLKAALESLDESQSTLMKVLKKSDAMEETFRVQEVRLRTDNEKLFARLREVNGEVQRLTSKCADLEAFMISKTSQESAEADIILANKYGRTNKGADGDGGDLFFQRENIQHQGKRCLLAKYARYLTSIYNSSQAPESLRSPTLDFSRCAITDMDMTQWVEWMKMMSLLPIKYIDLRSNQLTATGVETLCKFLTQLSADEYGRDSPLIIRMSQNKIAASAIPGVIKEINSSTNRPEIKGIETGEDWLDIAIYGIRRTSQRSGSAVFHLFFGDVPELVEREAQQSLALRNRPSTGTANMSAATSATNINKATGLGSVKVIGAPDSAVTPMSRAKKSRDVSPVNQSRMEFPSYLSSNISKSVATESMDSLVAKLHKFST